MGKRTQSPPAARTTAQVKRRLTQARRVLETHRSRLLQLKGVTGVDVGFRYRNGRRTHEVAIRVFVAQKLPEPALHPNRHLPESLRAEGVRARIPVDVIEAEFSPANDEETDLPTSQGGVRVARIVHMTKSGTLGLVVFTPSALEPRFLTNAHVVGGSSIEEADDRGLIVVQLPQQEGSTQPRRTLGSVLVSRTKLTRDVDCALVLPAPGLTWLPGILKILDEPDGIGQLTDDDVAKRTEVVKFGAATSRTVGTVESIAGSFQHTDGFRFHRQILVRSKTSAPFIAGGDSGAVLLKKNRVVGLLHGQAHTGRMGVACHMDKVADKIKITLPEEA